MQTTAITGVIADDIAKVSVIPTKRHREQVNRAGQVKDAGAAQVGAGPIAGRRIAGNAGVGNGHVARVVPQGTAFLGGVAVEAAADYGNISPSGHVQNAAVARHGAGVIIGEVHVRQGQRGTGYCARVELLLFIAPPLTVSVPLLRMAPPEFAGFPAPSARPLSRVRLTRVVVPLLVRIRPC